MKTLAGTLALLCLVAISITAFAQTAPPTDPFEGAYNVTINGSFSNVSNAATNNGFQTTEGIRFSQHLLVRSDQFVVLGPPSAVIVTAGPEYRFNLAHLLSKSNFAANASKVEAFGNVGAGTARSSAMNPDGTTTLSKAAFAYKVGGGFDILLNKTMSIRPLDISYVRAPMLQNGGSILGNQLQFAAGLGVRF